MFEGLQFHEALIFLLIGLLFFKEQILKYIGMAGDDTPEWAERLIQYANHDTTKMHEKTHSVLERVEDKQELIVTLIKEMKEYGIKVRN